MFNFLAHNFVMKSTNTMSNSYRGFVISTTISRN